MNASAPRILTTGQAAERLGVSVSTVRRMIDAEELPYVEKLPGHNGRYLLDASLVEYKRRELDAEKAQASA